MEGRGNLRRPSWVRICS